MRYRGLDHNGDMQPAVSILQGTEAVGAAVESRLKLYRGEWWEDTKVGFSIPDFLHRGARLSRDGAALMTNYISSYVADTPGVKEVLDASGGVDAHQLKYSCRVRTEYGTVERSVAQDALFYAIS